MAILNIPTDNDSRDGAFYFTVDLEGVTFQFDFQYNSREDFWYFDLSRDGEKIRAGVKVVVNFPSLLRCVDLEAPPGQLVFIDSRPIPGQPTFEELGKDVLMTYCEQSSLP